MIPAALLIGSIGVLAETSDIQRRAYNQALQEAGLDWHWDEAIYRDLLTESGGRKRLSCLNEKMSAKLSKSDIERIHTRKTELACHEIANNGSGLRPGIAETIEQALQHGLKIALVTTTYQANIDAIAAAAGSALQLSKFSAVLTMEDCNTPKPAPDIYREALSRLDVKSSEVVAIEDSATSVRSARTAGIYTVATPGEFTSEQDFSEADRVLPSLEGFKLEIPG